VIWHTGPLADLPPGEAVWLMRLDDTVVQEAASSAPLRKDDLRDLAQRPQAAMRAQRRQLAKALLAHAAQCHPDAVVLGRTAAGAPLVLAPLGWHVSLAGRWPHALIGISRMPIGVDIEPLDALPPPEDALTAGERREAISDHERLRRWVAKEAHAKLLGIASRIEPEDIETTAQGDLLRARSVQGSTLCHIKTTGHTLCAVARPIMDGAGVRPAPNIA
jgi:phosphopantetheinyl transferase